MAIRVLKPDVKVSVPPGVAAWTRRHHATVCKPQNLGCWNVRTLHDIAANVQLPERRSHLVAKELQLYDMDAVAVSEIFGGRVI